MARAARRLALAVLLTLDILAAAPLLGLPAAVNIATGSSMYPSVESGSLVVGVRVKGPPPPGSIIVYTSGGKYVLHRVVEAGDGWVVARGDNNVRSDGRIPLGRVLYRAVAVVPPERWVPALGLAAAALALADPAAGVMLGVAGAVAMAASLAGTSTAYPFKPPCLPVPQARARGDPPSMPVSGPVECLQGCTYDGGRITIEPGARVAIYRPASPACPPGIVVRVDTSIWVRRDCGWHSRPHYSRPATLSPCSWGYCPTPW